jgi:ribosomal protein L7Ae-like RNA K-turn-binding protein
LFAEIYAYGDEKQLPPIEDYDKLDIEHKPYYNFWHNEPAHQTLNVNYRQQGTLKDFVEIIENTLFNNRFRNNIPTPLLIGDNYSIHATEMDENLLLDDMVDSDIIITPYNKVRNLCNIICRKQIAKKNNKKFSQLPIVGDKIIFIDAIKKTVENTNMKYVYLAKNVYATINYIHEIDVKDELMIMDFTDETGMVHEHIVVSLGKLFGKTTTTPNHARIDFAYAVTAHSSQGGQWEKVLFLDSHFPNDLDKLRYVSVTRASKRLGIITGITTSTESVDSDKSILVRIANKLK